jgi:IclR family acetate operon transcriptional repressor
MASDVAKRSTSAKSQTIERAALILACFSAEKNHFTLAELAENLGLHQSTVYRYVTTLQRAGLLSRDERHGGYRLGLRVIELANVGLNQLEVRKQALDEMDRLRDSLDMLISLGVMFEGDVLHVAHAVPKEWPRWAMTEGRRAVAHCTSLGKVLLAYSPMDVVHATIEEYGWRPYTPHSIHDFERLAVTLAEVRERGYALDQEERRLGLCCVGAPIRDHTGTVIAALSISSKAERLMPILEDRCLPLLREAADRISFRLGYQGNSAYL